MRADLHLHSRYSDRPAEWLFRRFNFPDSYSDPRALLAQLRAAGMDAFTLTDHNRIDGCLDLAGEPGVFISEEVTAYFPEDRCKVHLLVWGITEAQHREIGGLRENIFDLQGYLAAQGLAHAVAHPLYSLNQQLNAGHLERLILLFKHFEGRNGLRDDLLNRAAGELFERLTPARIERFADRHQLAPTHPEPHRKILVAGSNDHGGIFPASAFTETTVGDGAAAAAAAPRTPADLLASVRAGQIAMRGHGGTPLALSHGLYNTVYSYAKDKFVRTSTQTPVLLETMFSRFMEGENPTEFSFADKLNFLAQGVLTGKIFELIKPGAAGSVWRELAAYFSQPAVKAAIARQTARVAEPERRSFLIANLFANQLAFRFFTKFVRQVSGGNMIEGLQAISAIVPLGVLLSPYLYAFQSQSPSRRDLRALSRELLDGETPAPPSLRNAKRAWFTDTLEDLNGVATTIQKMTAAGRAAGHDITVVTSRTAIAMSDIPLKNFPPIGEFEIPEYELQKLTFPPILEILDYIQRERFTELIISTPGPIGLTALLAAKLFKLRVVGIYHTDFPQYVQILTDDDFMESLTWRFMSWFYQQLDLVFVNSDFYRDIWMQRGIPAERLRVLPRGLDTERFHPGRRDADFWRRRGARDGELVLLYVGRVSVEKNLDVLAAAAHALLARDGGGAAGLPPLRVAIVGDGVYVPELRRLLPEGTIFTGSLTGADLAAAYASADIFGFPSTTDTFGNVVIEAQASGLPVVVSDQKGPPELVADGETGLITRGLDAADFARAVDRLARDPALRARMGAAARRAVEGRNWTRAFERFWGMSEE